MSDLYHELVPASPPQGSRLALVLHGVFGSGANWRLFMRRLAAARPDWHFALVDLRGHGKTGTLPPPHDLDAMVADLRALEAALPAPPAGVIGHSLGGKLALAYAAARPGELDQVWVLDAQPGVQPPSLPAAEILELLESLPERFADRGGFVATIEAAGHRPAMAQWLAMSLRRDEDDSYRLRLDLAAIRSLLEDSLRRDLWPEVERRDARRRLHVVMAGRSWVWHQGDRARLEDVETVELHLLEEASHWLHVDASEPLLALLAAQL